MLLSIIIPVYNGAKQIANCLDSIWAQKLNTEDYEVVCVDDCSTDNTQEVLTEICKEHSNLRLVKNDKNRRAGGSRNHGVMVAKGEYVVFIDADDYFHPQSLKNGLSYIKENNLDILICDSSREYLGKPNDKLTHNFSNRNIISGRDFMIINGLPYAPWKYLFKRSIMIENQIYFEENVSAEDVDWTHRMALHAQKTQYLPLLLTHYILAHSSQTADEFKKFNLIAERMFAGYRLNQLAIKYKDDKEVLNHLNIVAESFFHKALLFMTGIYCKPHIKSDAIKKYIHHYNGNKLIGFACKYPRLFAHLSNLSSPFIKCAIIVRRFIKGR